MGLDFLSCETELSANWRVLYVSVILRWPSVPPMSGLGQVSYRGVGLRSPRDSRLPSCFRASQRGGELAQAPGAAEVGAQGMGRGAGLGEEGGGEVSSPGPGPAPVIFSTPSGNRDAVRKEGWISALVELTP